MKKWICGLLVLQGSFSITYSQPLSIPFNHQLYYRVEESGNFISDQNKEFHTAMKPYNMAELNRSFNADSAIRGQFRVSKFGKTFIGRKVFHKHTFQLDSANFSLAASPLFNLEYGRDLMKDTTNVYTTNTRGLMLQGTIEKVVAFSASYLETQSKLFPYIANYVAEYQVVPNYGRFKPFKINGYDYGMASGYVTWMPSNHFSIQFGNDKNFIGEGYRSLLLSDNSFNYPFLKIATGFKCLKYYVLMAQLQDGITYADPQQPFQKKFFSVHFLSYSIGKRVQIGLFEGTNWHGKSLQKTSYNFANPIILSSWAQNGLAGINNVNLGLNLKVKVLNRTHLYGQFVLDDIGGSKKLDTISSSAKYGIQAGLKMYDFVFLKNFFWQVEFNQVSPYTYSSSLKGNEWSHYNQSLAHPVGANFREVLSFLSYRYGRVWAEAKGMYVQYGRDSASVSYGRNIFKGDQGSVVGKAWFQGQKATVAYADFKIGFIINPSFNLNVIAGINNRWETFGGQTKHIQYVFLGLKTSLYNIYHDF